MGPRMCFSILESRTLGLGGNPSLHNTVTLKASLPVHGIWANRWEQYPVLWLQIWWGLSSTQRECKLSRDYRVGKHEVKRALSLYKKEWTKNSQQVDSEEYYNTWETEHRLEDAREKWISAMDLFQNSSNLEENSLPFSKWCKNHVFYETEKCAEKTR